MSEEKTTTCPDCGAELTYNKSHKTWITFVECPDCEFEIDVDLYEDRE